MSAAEPQKAANGTWSFVVDVGIDPATGRRRQARRRGFATKKAAQEEMDRLRVKVHDRVYSKPTRQTLGAYLADWLDSLPTTGLRASTIDGYRRNLEGYVIPRLGHVPLEALTALDLDRTYAALLTEGRRQSTGGLSKRSVRYIHTTLRKALSDGVKKGLVTRNVADAASPPSAKSTKPPEMMWWRPDELRLFLDFTAGERLGALFHLAAMTGMRRGEVCGLRWADVDLDKSRLEVRQQLLAIDHQLVFSERTKSDHGRRTIDLDAGTVAVLRRQRARQAADRLALGSGYNDTGLVMTAADGGALDPESVALAFQRRVRRAGVPLIRFHDLRHTHVAHLIAAGEIPLLIARRLGHSSAAFTQDRYGHLFENAGSDAAGKVAAMVFAG